MRTIVRFGCGALLGAVAALAWTSVAQAQEQGQQQESSGPQSVESWRGFYVGAGGNYTTVSVERPNSAECDYDCYPWGGIPSAEEGDGDYGYNVHAGLRLHKYFAIEAAYLETGTVGWDESLVYIPELIPRLTITFTSATSLKLQRKPLTR